MQASQALRRPYIGRRTPKPHLPARSLFGQRLPGGFHTFTKPADYVLPKATTRSNFVFDGDLISSNARILLDYRNGTTSSTFTAANGTTLTGFLTDRGVKADFSPDCWNRFIGSWEIQSNQARTTGSGVQTMTTEATLPADIDISVDVSATAYAGLYIRKNGNDLFRIVLEFPAARLNAYEIFNFGSTTKLAGTTPVVSGTIYTLRVTTSGTTFNVYLNGVLEGTFTSTVNQTTGVDHGLFAASDTAARFDNYVVARRGLPAATAYTIRNYDGDVVASGSISDEYFDVADSLLKQRDNLGPYGWYRVYLTGPTHGDGQWGTAYGDCTFMRIPTSSLPANGGLTQSSAGQGDEIARGVMGMGTTRYSITNSAVAAATTIAAMTPLVSAAKTWNTDTASAARPRRILIAFPNGTAGNEANVTAIVTGLKTWVTAWECRNEPNYGYDPTTWTQGELTAFHTAVKAGDSNAVVMGPGSVSFRDGGSGADIAFFQAFLDAGGGTVTEAFSFHPYNCYQGDVATMRYTLGHLLTKMAAAGKSAYDMWMTEQGFGWAYAGIVWPHYAARWTSMMYFAQSVITADKMRPETTAYWYDLNIGFDDFPMQWLLDSGPGPTVGPVRTMSAEIYAKTFTSELDFGTYGKNLYIGGIWTDAGTGNKVIGVQASSYGANPIRLRTTGASTFTLVDPWGNTSTLTAVAGDLTVPVAELPQWVRIPSGSTAALEPTDWAWGTNKCLAGTAATSATTYTGLTLMNNDIQESPYAMGTILDSASQGFRATGPAGGDLTFPQTVDITFASQTITRAVVSCYAPWQYLGTLVDVDLQTFDGATWTTRKTWTGDLTKSFHFTSGIARCVVESYWQDQYLFDYQFPSPVTCQGVRCNIRNVSYTAFDTRDTSDTANNGQNGFGYHITIREIQAFNYTPAGAASSPTTFIRQSATRAGTW